MSKDSTLGIGNSMGGLSYCSFVRVTLQGTNISNLWKRNIIFKSVFGRDLV